MLRKFSIALLLMAAPAVAQDPRPADPPEEEATTDPKPLPYKLKKVCRPQEVVGSSIPRMICSNKRVYLKPGEVADEKAKGQPSSDSSR